MITENQSMVQAWCPVVSNTAPGRKYILLELENQQIADTAQPGQFVMVRAGTGSQPLLARPFALFDTNKNARTFRILFMVVGAGTELLAAIDSGSIRVTGPLGKPFRLYGQSDTHIAVGGGTGVAAVYALMKMRESLIHGTTGNFMLLTGARGDWGLLNNDIIRQAGVDVFESTDDGSRGYHGTVLDLLRIKLDELPPAAKPALYTAGPEPMMRAVAELAKQRDLPCQVSLESRMACGIGICRGCVCNGVSPHPETGRMRLAVCTDGPVFSMDEIRWE